VFVNARIIHEVRVPDKHSLTLHRLDGNWFQVCFSLGLNIVKIYEMVLWVETYELCNHWVNSECFIWVIWLTTLWHLKLCHFIWT